MISLHHSVGAMDSACGLHLHLHAPPQNSRFLPSPTNTIININGTHPFNKSKLSTSSSSRVRPRVRCRYSDDDDDGDGPLTVSSAYDVLGLTPQCSSAQIKAAFRTKEIISTAPSSPFSPIYCPFFHSCGLGVCVAGQAVSSGCNWSCSKFGCHYSPCDSSI